jgi:hypothetical protein
VSGKCRVRSPQSHVQSTSVSRTPHFVELGISAKIVQLLRVLILNRWSRDARRNCSAVANRQSKTQNAAPWGISRQRTFFPCRDPPGITQVDPGRYRSEPSSCFRLKQPLPGAIGPAQTAWRCYGNSCLASATSLMRICGIR